MRLDIGDALENQLYFDGQHRGHTEGEDDEKVHKGASEEPKRLKECGDGTSVPRCTNRSVGMSAMVGKYSLSPLQGMELG